ncbi:hypothetical protein NXW97_24405 [Bacteroides faecis]|uniref:Uncharacterized protein n=1 Tax=Bacteroides faecis TaxID=674529 RepID=A0AAW5P223_9BACE|nr:hypothetical protein [Bacteroides faecis]MCS2795092.1 hypothetical protein [Bacteroides faecis]
MMFSLMADANWKEFDLSVQLQVPLCATNLPLGEWNNGARDQTPLHVLSMPDGITRLTTW